MCVAHRGRFPDQSLICDYRHIALDAILLAAIDRDRVPPGRSIARDNFSRNEFENRALPIIERVPQAVDLVLDVAQAPDWSRGAADCPPAKPCSRAPVLPATSIRCAPT